jgi:hypothetical protein
LTDSGAEASPESGGETRRALALDAFRGFAILAMVVSWIVPERVLPAWMYHAQTPPPLHKFNPNLAGITWVDLVFPFFLFSMGAAMPLALSRRIARGTAYWRIAGQVLLRGLLLAGFAVYIAHIRPLTINPNPTRGTWLMALLGFVLLFPILARLPTTWGIGARGITRAVGWGGAVALLASLRYPDGSGFSVARNDIIIMLLANMAVFGSLLWLASQTRILLRLGVLGMLIALRLAAPLAGWVGWLYANVQVTYFFQLGYLQLLFIVIPGTIVGDLILSWMSAPAPNAARRTAWSLARLAAICILMCALAVLMLVGLKARWLWQTVAAAAGMCGLGWWLLSRPTTATERLLHEIYSWGVYWLALGLLFEPYEGGIKKDPATMSYYFVTVALSGFLLIAFIIVADVWSQTRRVKLLVDNGQNPLMAYAGAQNLIGAALGVAGLVGPLDAMGRSHPALGVIIVVLYALALAGAVAFFTRRQIFWRT